MKKEFTPEKKLRILRLGDKYGIKKVSEKVGIHYTTWYDWKKKVETGGETALSPQRNNGKEEQKEIPEWKRKEVLIEKEENPGYCPSQIRNQLRRRGITISTLTIRQIIEEAGYDKKKGPRKKPGCDLRRPVHSSWFRSTSANFTSTNCVCILPFCWTIFPVFFWGSLCRASCLGLRNGSS